MFGVLWSATFIHSGVFPLFMAEKWQVDGLNPTHDDLLGIIFELFIDSNTNCSKLQTIIILPPQYSMEKLRSPPAPARTGKGPNGRFLCLCLDFG